MWHRANTHAGAILRGICEGAINMLTVFVTGRMTAYDGGIEVFRIITARCVDNAKA
jgi:hypothetical protein